MSVKLPSLEVIRNKMVEGLSPVEVYEQWTTRVPDATPEMKSDVRAAIALVWKDAREASTKHRTWKKQA